MLPAFLFYSKQTIRLATVNNMFTDGKRHFSQSNVANVATLRKHPHSIFVEV